MLFTRPHFFIDDFMMMQSAVLDIKKMDFCCDFKFFRKGFQNILLDFNISADMVSIL